MRLLMKFLFKIFLFCIVVFFLFKIAYFFTHRRPLEFKEMQKLSAIRRMQYIKNTYNFNYYNVPVNIVFKSSMKPGGAWYDVREDLYSFPSLVATLLKGKKHEWVIFAIEQRGIVYGFYANKGENNFEVTPNCSVEFLVSKCEEYGCETILCFHNHPNSNPHYTDCLVPSKQDFRSANYFAECLNLKYNFIDFVCERGRFIKFFESYSANFVPDVARIENIQKENNISKWNNYKLHREIRKNRSLLY